ncbi:MAG: peptidoglycan-binding domain-containing protein [Paracoccaceae bacterium]
MAIRMILVGLIVALFGVKAQGGENLALIIANKDYRHFSDSRDAFDATDVNRAFIDAGFEVRTIRNLSRKAMERLVPVIRTEIDQAERVVVFLTGHVFSTSQESWLMATDAPRQDSLLTGAYGLPISMIVDLLGEKAGAAILLVGDSGNPQSLGAGLSYGYVPNDIAQGVTVFTGRTGRLTSLLQDTLLVAGTSTFSAAKRAPRGVTGFGFLSRSVAFLPIAAETPVAVEEPVDELEMLIWENAKALGTEAGISSYLDRFPNGHFVTEANAMLVQLQKSPSDQAKDAEIALNLNREAKRDIQRNLSLLDYNTRGVDGIFGPGTRAAVTAWQRSSGYSANGFLTELQISALQDQAEVRAAELEEEARTRRLELEQQDAEFWRSTGRGGGEAGLRAYIRKYPDGLYADIASDRLQVFDEERRLSAEIAERNAWDVAQETGSIDGYSEFLQNYHDGVFAESAAERLAALRASQADSATIAQERTVLANPITRILVEQKLAALGYKPGRVDGRIDEDTRKAVRKFQRAADLPVSGYITQATIVRLLAAR